MRLNRFIFFGIVLALRCDFFNAIAIERETNLSAANFVVSTWKTGDGLPANEILDLQATPDGYLWMGTHHGLVRFDGVRFDTFFNVPTGLRYGTHVGPLEVDSRGRLWLAPDEQGIVRRDADKFSELLTNTALFSARAVSLCSDGKNSILWVDANGKVGRISEKSPEKMERIDGEATANSRWVRDFQTNLWLVSPRTLKSFRDGEWQEIKLRSNATFTVAPRREGGLWIAREGNLRFVTTNGLSAQVAKFPWVGQSRVICLLEDEKHQVWIGTANQGLHCYAAGKFEQVVPTTSGILCLLEDEQQNIWAGTRGGGLVRVRARQFFIHDLSSGLKNEFVRSLAQDKDGRLWMVSAENALGFWKDGTWQELDPEHGWPGRDALCVLPSADGGVWISTARRELWYWKDGKSIKRIFGPKGLREPAMDLLEDRNGRLWMATDNSGIFCLQGERLKSYWMANGLPSNLIRCVVEDESGNVFAGDWEGGISRFADQRWEIVRPPSGHRDAVRSIIPDKGALWIATSAGGLLRFKDGKTARISADQGLPDVCVHQLLNDGRGSLWGGTPHKLFSISIAQLDAVANGRGKMINPILRGRNDGLPDVSFANWSDPRCWRAQDGELWFATANGAIHFQPAELPVSKTPQVLLDQTLLDGEPIDPEALQKLRPGPGRLEFRYTAPCLTAPERVRFRYQLVGVDADWVDAGTARTATYGSIPAGHHTFRVIASSPEGIWSTTPATVALAVHPYFWQTDWFLAAVTALVASGAVWIIRRATVRRLKLRLENLRHQHAVDRERARIAQDIHDELGANLTSIGLLADMGQRHKLDSNAVSRELKQISTTARESVAAMDAIVWALNPSNDSLDHFANYLAQFTRDFFRPTQLRTRLDLPPNLPVHSMSTETRHQLLLLVKEAFNNIVRHAVATEVDLKLACENGQLRLTIADNGKGLSDRNFSEGQDGMTNMRERIERIGGAFCVETKPDSGTRLEFRLPTNRFGANDLC